MGCNSRERRLILLVMFVKRKGTEPSRLHQMWLEKCLRAAIHNLRTEALQLPSSGIPEVLKVILDDEPAPPRPRRGVAVHPYELGVARALDLTSASLLLLYCASSLSLPSLPSAQLFCTSPRIRADDPTHLPERHVHPSRPHTLLERDDLIEEPLRRAAHDVRADAGLGEARKVAIGGVARERGGEVRVGAVREVARVRGDVYEGEVDEVVLLLAHVGLYLTRSPA